MASGQTYRRVSRSARCGAIAARVGRILITRLDPDVDIHSRPRVAVNREGMGPDHEETGLFGDESAQDVSVVLVHRFADLLLA